MMAMLRRSRGFFVAGQWSRSTTTILRADRSSSFELEGRLIEVGDILEFDSGRRKREFVVRTNELYPQEIKFDVWNERCDLLENIPTASDVTVSFNIKGSVYNHRHFVNLNAWRIARSQQSYAAPTYQRPQVVERHDDTTADDTTTDDGGDDEDGVNPSLLGGTDDQKTDSKENNGGGRLPF